jgi:hypothetical protein
MLKINNYDTSSDKVSLTCLCGETFVSSFDTNELQFIKEFDQYENIAVPCPTCKRTHVLNMNIPESEYDEIELEETLMATSDINGRKVLRDIMWVKRKDLKGKNRAAFNKTREFKIKEWEDKKQAMIEAHNAKMESIISEKLSAVEKQLKKQHIRPLPERRTK